MKARTVVGRGEKSLFSEPGSELRLGKEKEKENCEYNRRDEQKKKRKKNLVRSGMPAPTSPRHTLVFCDTKMNIASGAD